MQNHFSSSDDRNLRRNDKKFTNADVCQRAWVEVYPASIEANARKIKNFLKSDCLLMAVVKADGYGHGAETVARAALIGGANNLGVATLQEGIELRKAGIDCPILILGNLICIEEFESCLHWRLMPTLSSMREALLCQTLAEAKGRILSVQVKFDTGMTRLGCDLNEAPSLIQNVSQSSYLDLKGIYSHLALADESLNGELPTFTQLQQQRFEDILGSLPSRNNEVCCHLANSAGTLRDRQLHYDMVRVGLAIYGYSPIRHLHTDLDLKPALAIKARVIFLREVPKGIGVSYGLRFETSRPSLLAVVAIGYADGVSRSLSGRISALFNGQFLPQIGAITMDQLVLDATDYPQIEVGNVVTLLGEDCNKCITPQQWSDLSGTIPWEVLCGFKRRLPRLVI